MHIPEHTHRKWHHLYKLKGAGVTTHPSCSLCWKVPKHTRLWGHKNEAHQLGILLSRTWHRLSWQEGNHNSPTKWLYVPSLQLHSQVPLLACIWVLLTPELYFLSVGRGREGYFLGPSWWLAVFVFPFPSVANAYSITYCDPHTLDIDMSAKRHYLPR